LQSRPNAEYDIANRPERRFGHDIIYNQEDYLYNMFILSIGEIRISDCEYGFDHNPQNNMITARTRC